MCFSLNFQANSCRFFVCFVCLFFRDEMTFSSILRIETIFFWRHSILRLKKSQLAFNFELTRTLTIYGEHGVMTFSKIQLLVYYECCILIGRATTGLYVIAH